MSLRKIAKELGVSHTLLVLWRQGKRKLSPELEARYHQLVTSGYKSGYNPEIETNKNIHSEGYVRHGKEVVGGTGFEPVTSAMSTQRSKPLS